MKRKILIISVLLIIMMTPAVLFAEAELSELYAKTAFISKIYPHQKGYKVVYVKSNMNLGEFYVPIEWFQEAGGKAEILYGNSSSFPYFTAYYNHEEGTLDHIRLYVHDDINNFSWGSFDRTSDVDEHFTEVETLEIDY